MHLVIACANIEHEMGGIPSTHLHQHICYRSAYQGSSPILTTVTAKVFATLPVMVGREHKQKRCCDADLLRVCPPLNIAICTFAASDHHDNMPVEVIRCC